MSEDYPPGLVCVPHQDWAYTRSLISLTAITHNLPPGTEWDWAGSNLERVPQKRNSAAEHLLDNPRLKWLAYFDSDQVYPPDVLQRLLSLDADIAGGFVLKKYKAADYLPCAGLISNLPDDAPRERPTDTEEFTWNPLNVMDAGEKFEAVEVDVLGTGAMLVHRRVFEYMDPPWFVVNEEVNPGYNEDYNFCIRAKREFDFKIVCDTTLQIEHIGPQGVGVDEARGHWREHVLG